MQEMKVAPVCFTD